jgi:glycosyltransferase involved in cell wall biosynthesis
MRLLYWSDCWSPLIGGIEVLGEQCLRELQLRGFEPLVVTSHWDRELPDEEERDGIKVHRLPFNEALQGRRLDLFASALKRVQHLRRSWQPDIVHLHFPSPSGLFHLRTSEASSVPLVLAMHTYVPEWDTGADTLSSKLLRQSAWLTANSSATLDVVRAAYHEIADRSSIVYNGLRQPALPPAPLCFDPPVVACIGRLVFNKGIDVAVRAMSSVRKGIPGARLSIAGDGPARPELERLANTLGLSACVNFRGWVAPEKVAAFLNESTLVAVPSRSMEPFGNVALEAMQMARPVVASNQGGLPEVVVDGETGYIIGPDDPEALADRIVKLAGDPVLAARMGAAGQERARLHFNLERYVENYVSLYRRLAG